MLLKKLSIIIVNYNSGEDLIVCINSIRKYLINISYEILLVDNNSTDNSRELLKENFKDIQKYFLQTNTGYAFANNYGIKKSIGDYILLLNPDTTLIDYSLEKMIQFLYNNSYVGVVGPDLISSKGEDHLPPDYFPLLKHQIMEALFFHKYYSRYRKKAHHQRIENNLLPYEVDWVSGSCFLFRKEVFKQTGGFDEQFHIYAEDVDWCKRIRDRGWKIFSFLECKIVHLKGTSTHKDYYSLVLNRYKSKRIYAQKHYTPIKFIILHICVLIGLILRIMGVPFKKSNNMNEKKQRLRGYVYSIVVWIGFGAIIRIDRQMEELI